MSDTTYDNICHKENIAFTLKDEREIWTHTDQHVDMFFVARENNYNNLPPTILLLNIDIYNSTANHFMQFQEWQQDDSNLINSNTTIPSKYMSTEINSKWPLCIIANFNKIRFRNNAYN